MRGNFEDQDKFANFECLRNLGVDFFFIISSLESKTSKHLFYVASLIISLFKWAHLLCNFAIRINKWYIFVSNLYPESVLEPSYYDH